MLRNQRAFLFPVELADSESAVFTVGPLQPGELLVSIDFALHVKAGGNSTVELRVAVSDEPINTTNFFTDTAQFTFNSEPVLMRFQQFRDLFREFSIPMNRWASDRERYFSVHLFNVDTAGDVAGSISYNIVFTPSNS